ncbi:glycosyltransferase family 39 protein [Microbacterium sp. 1.5R]|uniref:ArnT family glycosyltransferase n=1 Tax=Microbacterium sp. 1.5R TaxID=1916917 RepID=UPI00119C9BE7|nr:glycosyltransferase family 39 protein [Microbacterium sp. 1.5R]
MSTTLEKTAEIEREPAGSSTPTVDGASAKTPSGPGRVSLWFRTHGGDLLWLLPVLLVSGVVNFLNVGGSPQRIDDEGTYTAQAWAVTHLGELAHYTYWYDHPPLGWLQIAGYTQLTGAFERWDVAVLAGREAVLVAALISIVLLWALARRLGMSRFASAATGLVFAVSPLALQFHRTVYLDNIAVPWLLLAFFLATNRRGQLAAFAGSALAFGIAVLTKETFLLALPILAWVMLRSARRETRRYTLSVAASILVLIGGSYLLLAAVKGELLSGADRVSLMEGITFQLASRESSGSIADPDSLINRTLSMWWQLDPVFIVVSLIAAVYALLLPRLRPYAVLVLAMTAFMFRPGGYLPVPYVIMLIPFGALLIAGAADSAVVRFRHKSATRRGLAAGFVAVAAVGAIVAVPLWSTQLRGFVLADLDAPLRGAEQWLDENATTDQRIIVDDAMWVDLVRAGWDRDNVIWYYKLDTDPAVQADSPNGWRDADYVVTTDSMRTFPGAFPQVQEAIDNSVVVASFGTGPQAVEVRRVTIDGAEQAAISQEDAVAQRAQLGAQLATNPAVVLTGADRDRLVAGQIDVRIISVLAAVAGTGSVSVAGFPVVDGEGDESFRQLEVSAIGGSPVAEGGRVTPEGRAFLDSLTGAYEPTEVAVSDDTVVLRYPISLQPVLP